MHACGTSCPGTRPCFAGVECTADQVARLAFLRALRIVPMHLESGVGWSNMLELRFGPLNMSR